MDLYNKNGRIPHYKAERPLLRRHLTKYKAYPLGRPFLEGVKQVAYKEKAGSYILASNIVEFDMPAYPGLYPSFPELIPTFGRHTFYGQGPAKTSPA